MQFCFAGWVPHVYMYKYIYSKTYMVMAQKIWTIHSKSAFHSFYLFFPSELELVKQLNLNIIILGFWLLKPNLWIF